MKRDKKDEKGKPDDPWKDMTWKEINKALDIAALMERFEKYQGELSNITSLDMLKNMLRLPNKVDKWIKGFEIFSEGAKAGKEMAWKWIMNSGWLKKIVQEEFEKQMKGDENGEEYRTGSKGH